MFVKLDGDTILDMSTGTCYRYRTLKDGSELVITFNGPQSDKYCSNEVADELWTWLYKAALKFETDPVQEQ